MRTKFSLQEKWLRLPFTRENVIDSSSLAGPETRVSGNGLMAAEDAAMAKLRGWPAPIRIGPIEGEHKVGGSGIFVTDGERHAVLTAGHVADGIMEADNAGSPVWAQVSGRVPRSGRRGEISTASSRPVRIKSCAFIEPEASNGRVDIGIARLFTEDVEAACADLRIKALDLRDAQRKMPARAIDGLHVAVGTPNDRADDGRGLTFVEAIALRPAREYECDEMKYIGYGVNGPMEVGQDRNREYGGFSGSPVWSFKLRPDAVSRLSRDHAEASIDDFVEPTLVGILCYQEKEIWGMNLRPPKGYIHEVYAHEIDNAFLGEVERLLRTAPI